MEPRVVPVFEHQTLVTLFGVQARIRSDTIPLEGADRISCGFTVEYGWVPPAPAPPPNQFSVLYFSEVSDDGVYWVG